MPYTQDEMDALLAKAREKDLAKGGEQGDEMDALLAKARDKDRAKGIGGATKQPLYSLPSWLQPEDKATAALVKEGQLRDALQSGDEELAQEIYSSMVVDEVNNTIGQWSKDHVKEAAQSIYKPREINRPAEDINQRRDYVEKAEEATFGRYAKDKFAKVKDVRVKEKVEEDDRLRGFTVRKHAKDIVDSYIKENPDKEEYRGLYELYVADEIQRGIVVEQTKEERLRELQEKTNEIYKRSGWFSSLVPDWRNRTLSLITLMPWFTNDDLVGEDFAEALNTEELDFLTGIPWLIDEATGRYQARSLSKNIDAYLDPSFGKGFLAEFDHSEVPSFGFVGLVSELDKLNIAMKVKDGEELSAREKDILELMQIEQEAMALNYEINGEEWNTASLGRGVGFSTEIISQIILGMVATGGVGNVATLSAQGGKIFVQQGVKQGTKAAVKKVAKEAVEEGIKQVTKKEAAVILAKNAGVLAGRSAIATAASPMTWHNFLDRRVGQYSFDENGEIVYTEQSWASDLFKAYTESFFEYYSEMLGAEVGALINLSPARLGRIVGLGKWGKAGEKSMDFLADISSSYSVRTALNKVGMQGLTGEVLSEVGGDVMTNLMLMPFYDEYNMQFLSDPHYWGDVVMTSGILGAAHTTIGAATGMSNLGEVRKAIKTRDLAFSNISDAALADELKRISTLETTLEISEALANLKLDDKTKYSDAERATAMEYITNDLIVKASYGAILENSRLERFYKLTRDTNNLAYEDSDRILTIKTKDGKMYYVKNGDIDDANSMLNCIDTKGNKVAILASEVQSSRETTIGQALASVYDTFYMRENIGERLMEVESTLRQMKEPTREKVQAYLEENGLTIFKEGDVVTLADGTQGSVESVLDNGDYVVKITDPEGEVALIQVPALQVLQPNAEVAKAQKIMFKQKSEKVLGDVSRAIENEQKAETTPQAEDTTADDAKTLEEDEKELMSTFPVTEDGSPDFDAISSPKQYALLFAKEMGGKEAAHAQMQQMKTNAVEEVEKLREKGKKLSKANDVVKNNKAIAELEQRISFYDEVLNNLQVKQDVVEENVADNVEEAKEAMDKAEAIAKEPRHAYKVGDVVDHNGRNARVIEVHDGGVLVIDYSMGASVVGDTEVVGSDEVTPSTATIPMNVLEENVEEQSEGLVMNGFAKRLTPRFKKIVDALARLLKVKVVFVETLGDANGYISGTTIYLSYAKRDKGVGFLTGHEVTHRLQEVAPEAYAKFKKAAKKYLGKEWDKEVNKTIATYEAVNRRRTRKAQAVNDALKAVDEAIANGEEDVQAVKENLAKLEIGEDKEVALAAGRARMHVENIERELGGSATLQDIKTKLEAEQASPEPLLKYTKDSIEDEVTADVAGKMSEKYFAIDKFLRGIDDSHLKRIMRDIWQFIKDLFTNLGADTEANRARKCVEKLNALIAEGVKSEATQKRKSKSGARPSLIGEVGAEALDRAEEATIRMDNLAVAREMENAGKDAKAIRMATGWERGADGLWRYELMDAEVNLYDGNENTIRKKIEVAEEEEKDFMQQSKADTKELRERTNTYLAEMREKYGVAEGEETDAMTEEETIQDVEGFAEGGSPAFLNKKLSDRLNAVTKELEKLRAEGKTEEADALVKLNKGLAEAVINNDTDDYGNYQKLMGEVEARNVSSRINMTAEERRATLLSETEDVAREDQIFLREGAEMAMAQPKFPLSEETTQIFDAAKAKFGTTYDMREAGYILPDGSMLDFSGRHQVEGDASFLNGDRTVDHREIADIAYDNDDNETGINTDLGDFLDRGAIRIDSNAGAINLNVAPTKAQKDRLKRLIERNDGYVYIDFGKGWDTEHYAEYEAARASRVLGDIDRYFDEGIKPAGNVRFSLQETNDRFNAELATLTEENAREKILNVGTPSSILLACGIENKPIRLYGAKLLSKVRKHGYDLDDLKNLPLAMSEPIAVFNGSKPNSFAILTELRVGDNNILAALSVGKGGHDVDFNIISSVYDKRGDSVARWVNDGKMLWVDKKKALDYFSVSAPLAEAQNNQELISTANIIQNFQNPKIEARNSLITPEMDASYLDAVERGDMETAQKMVMEAAKLAMPNTKVVDENGNPKVVYHGTPNNFNAFSKEMFGASTDRGIWGNGFYFSDSEQYAKTYEKRGDKQGRTLTVFLNIENPLFISLRNGGNEGAMYFHELMEKHFTDDIYEDVTRTDELMSVAQERLTADIVANGYDGIVVEYTNHIDTEYVAFEPNQIKSADPVTYDDNGNVIPLSERFNPRKEDIRYSLIGEQGASTLDAYEEATTRLDNLNVAREMEAQGKDALAIKQATGWERGKDGLWRYEVADYVSMFDFTGNVDYMRRHPEYKRYKELLRKRNAGMMFFKKGLTKEEQKEFDDLAIVYGNGVQPHNSHKLKDYLDSEELFAAYPQLRDINVEIKKELEDGYYGRYIPSRNTIELATRKHEYMARTLFHEVQHAIQHIEGFANGGNTEIADPRKVRERKEAMEGLQRKIDMHERTLERFEAELSELNNSMEKWWKSHPEAMSREDFDSEMQALSEVYDEQLKKAEREQNKLRETQKEYKKLVESSATLDYEGYERLAGEVEARATARRVGMSEEERRNTLQLNDEDIARKDQIILRNGLFENYADAQEVGPRYSISAPSYTDRMVDISDVMTVAEHKTAMLENAKRMASEGMDAQKIVDETGWIELEDGWHYYGDADIVLSDAKSNILRVQRWLESKRAVKRAQVRKLYAPLIKEQEALISDLEKGRAVKGRTSANYANAVEAILDGQAVESIPIEDQILVDIALGQKLRWADEKDGSRRGLATELGLRNAKAEKMDAVTRGAKDYIEDYVAALVERNKGYENGIDDNDVRNAVIEAFRSYPSRQAALDELSARYPNAATTEAREGLARLEFERDEALAEIDAEHRATMEDFEVDTERYMREYEDAQAWNESIDVYTQSLTKARNEIKRLEREAEKAGLTQREKDAAIAALKSQVRSLLSDGVNLYMRKREIQAIMNAVNEAQTTYAMVRAVEKAMWSIYEARMRMELTRLNNLLRLKLDPTLNNIDVPLFLRNAIEGGRLTMGQAKKLMEEYFKGVNGKGISVARYIDGDTATIMGFIAAYSDLKGMATTEGFNIDALCEELREALMGENIDHKYVTKEKQKAYSALDASVRDRMLGAVPIIRGLLEAQQLINGLQQSSEAYAVTTEIEDVKREIDALNAEIAEIENEGKVVMQGKVYKDKQKLLKDKKKQLRDLNKKVVTARIADAELYLGAMPNIVESLDQLNGTLETLVREGRIRLSEFHQKREERRRDLVNMAIEDIDRPAALGQGKIQYSAWQKIRAAKPIGWALGVLESLDHLLRVAARNAPDGEGHMWNHFSKAINGAYNRIFDAQKACYDELSAKTKSLFGTEYDRTMRKAERTTIGTYSIPHRIERVENGERVYEDTTEEVDLTISQALDIISMWNQPNGKETLMRQGFTEAKIEEIKTGLNNNDTKWLEFQQWVVNEFLPAKRVKYNNVHREMNGVDMDYEVNYFPMRRDTQFMPTPVDITSPDFVNTPNSSVSTGAIIKRQNSLRPFDLEASFFMVLKEHLVEMERWSEMAPVTRDLNLLLSSPTVKKALESVGEGFYQKFVDAAKLATGNFQEQSGAFDELFWQVALRRWASARLALKAYTALKQMASSILFLQYAKSPSFIGRLLWYCSGGNIPLADRIYQHIAQGAHWDIKSNKDSHTNITWALENSAMFRKRWASGTAGYDLFSQDMVYGNGKTRLARFVNDALKLVDKTSSLMLRAIAIVDAFTSAAGMRAVYEEEMVDLMKQGLSKSEAHDIALFRAEIAVNKTQQSSENLYLSPVQKSKGFVARSLTTFMNAPIAQGRNIAEAIRELGRNRETERREVYKQERKRWKEYYQPWYEVQEETIKKEKEEGIIETAEQEEMRRRQLYKEVDKRVDVMAEKAVGTRIKRAKTRALLTIFLNAWIGPAVFNLMSIAPYMLMGDDDEEKEKMMNAYWLQTALGPLQVLPLGPQIVSAFTGYKFDVSSPLTAFSTDINNIVREVQEQGFSVDAAMLVGDFILEHGMGVDVDTLMGMYAGIESLFEDGYSREAVLMMMGAPNSQVKLLARERKEGETAQEYYTRLMRLFSILEKPKYEDYFTEDGGHLGDPPFGMKESQMRDMRSNWEYAYRLDVVNRNGMEGEYSDMVNTTDLYKENAKLLPSVEKAFSKGEFRENTKIGDHVLNKEEYIALDKLRKKANNRESDTEHFLGQDEQEYLKWLRREVEAKRAFNDKLSEITNK